MNRTQEIMELEGFKTLTPIQEATLNRKDRSRDFIGISSTGSGKSVFIHNIVLSLIYKSSPDDLRLIMIDPKKVEFNRYNGLPHLLTPEVVMGSDKAINALKWCVKEMERRYDLMSKSGYNNIEPYNKSELVKAGQFERFPYIVIIVDELAEIMQVNKKEVDIASILLLNTRLVGCNSSEFKIRDLIDSPLASTTKGEPLFFADGSAIVDIFFSICKYCRLD